MANCHDVYYNIVGGRLIARLETSEDFGGIGQVNIETVVTGSKGRPTLRHPINRYHGIKGAVAYATPKHGPADGDFAVRPIYSGFRGNQFCGADGCSPDFDGWRQLAGHDADIPEF